MSSPASPSRAAVQIGPGTFALRPTDRSRQTTWRRWHRIASALEHSSTGDKFACPSCGHSFYVTQFEFAHYPKTPKRDDLGRRSVFGNRMVSRQVLNAEDIEALQHGRFICASCHALETSVQHLRKEWDDDIAFVSADAQSRWSQARNAGVPADEADPQRMGQPAKGASSGAG